MPGGRGDILVVTPLMPYPINGACHADRSGGILQLSRLGYEVRVIAMVQEWQEKDIQGFREHVGVPVTTVPYRGGWSGSGTAGKVRRVIDILRNPAFVDGSAYAYSDPGIQDAFRQELDAHRPDLVWFDYSYLWPLYSEARRRGIPCVTRSINYEPSHFLQEGGDTPINRLKYVPKAFSERVTARESAHLFSITPTEESIYRRFAPRQVETLPLRGLPDCLERPATPRDRGRLKIVFMAGSFGIPHNRKAMEMVTHAIAPEVERRMPGVFTFHVTGRKVPETFKATASKNVVFEDFVDDLDMFLSDMDLAVVPSLYGAGMQQKIFEPLCRRIPLVTSERGIAGYPFLHRRHVLFAEGADGFAEAIVSLADFGMRKRLADEAYRLSQELFSRERLDALVGERLDGLMKKEAAV